MGPLTLSELILSLSKLLAVAILMFLFFYAYNCNNLELDVPAFVSNLRMFPGLFDGFKNKALNYPDWFLKFDWCVLLYPSFAYGDIYFSLLDL